MMINQFARAAALHAHFADYTGKRIAKRLSADDYTALLAAMCVVDLKDEPERALEAAKLVTLTAADKARVKLGEWPHAGMRVAVAEHSLTLEATHRYRRSHATAPSVAGAVAVAGAVPLARIVSPGVVAVDAERITIGEPEPGIYKVQAETYHAWPAVHATALPRLAESFAKYSAPHEVNSPAADIGSYTHAEFLEGAGSIYTIVDAATRRSKAWKECEATLKLTQRELEKAHNCIEAIKANALIMAMMDRATVEQSIVWHEQVNGVTIVCKARIDVVTRLGDLCDLKTTAKGVGREAYSSKMNYGLPFQMAFYRRACQSQGIEINRCMIWLAPTAEPYVPAEVHQVPDADVNRAWQIIEDRMLPRLALHKQQPDAWPGIRPGKRPSVNTHWHQGEWFWRKWGVE